MKQYRPVEMIVISMEDKDVLTLSVAGQVSVDEKRDAMKWGQSQYD